MEQQALTGLRVLDASRVLAGPYCAQMLGDLGAEVIKIESPAGDETRSFGAAVHDNTAAYYLALNRNKRGIVLDMGKDQARDVFWTLLESADVLIENFKASTLRSWGIEDPSEIVERFPRLVHCRITGFGDDGPLGEAPGYDAAIQAVSGLMSINGESDGPALRMGVPIVDLATGMQATIAVLAAVQERTRSGRGQMCDVALFDCAMAVAHPHLSNYLWSGNEPAKSGNSHPNIAPYDAYATRTCAVYIAIGNERQLAALWRVLGSPELENDSRFKTNIDRIRNRTQLNAVLDGLLHELDGYAVAEALQAAGVPCTPVTSIAQAAGSAHAKHRNMVLRDEHYVGAGFPIKMRRTPLRLRELPPKHGEHSREVMLEAGFSEDQIKSLEQIGVFGMAEQR
ncbi:MAG TPA: CoA transferase [Burkholderiaceae bacterium]|nr:CoA transferase [Burkholderiaceae bacterium]